MVGTGVSGCNVSDRQHFETDGTVGVSGACAMIGGVSFHEGAGGRISSCVVDGGGITSGHARLLPRRRNLYGWRRHLLWNVC